MSVEENIATTRRWYAEWNGEGLPGFERVWAPDIVLYEDEDFPETGVFRGTKELASHVKELLAGGGHFQMVPVSLEGNGDWDGLIVELRDFHDGERARGVYEVLTGTDR